MVEAILSYVIKAIDESSSVMDRIKGSVGLLGSSLSGLGGGFAEVGNVMTGFAAGGPAGAAITALGEVAKGLQDCIKDAAASEAVFTSLGAAVTRSGTAWDTVSEATKNALLAMQATTVYSDEQLAAALERLMTFGLSYADSMNALGKAVDFASAKHMDLTSAATLVGKAMDGNTGILKRYGVDVASSKDQIAALKDAHDAAATAIKAMGAGIDAWVTSVTAAIGADSTFESGLASAKDKAQYLIDQFQQGNIDLPQFTQAMTSLGVPLNEAAMKGGTAAEVLAKLNEQFGGAAQANASTYAGLQERLKNATQEVGEKIGTIFLPALASLTEGMLPLVDNLGKAVDATTAWLTEVAKMPEVKGVLDVLGPAFDAFAKYLGELWQFLVSQFGPVLTELIGAFKELWDALSPIGEAISELRAAFGDTGDIDLFKILIMAVVEQIKAVGFIIKEVAPYIKAFAQAFKDAADFVTPILTQIVNVVRAFTDALRVIFQDFYGWLIGGSLWSDLWNAVISKTGEAISQLLSDLGSKLFEPMKTAFTIALQQVQSTWSAGWQSVQMTFNTIVSQIQADLNTRLNTMIADLRESTNQYAPTAALALQAMQSAMNGIMALIHGDWQGFLAGMSSAMGFYWQAIQDATAVALGQLQASFASGMGTIQGILQGAVASMQGIWQGFADFMSGAIASFQSAISGAASFLDSTLSGMESAASSTLSSIEGMVSSAWSAVTSAVSSMGSTITDAVSSAWSDLTDAATTAASTIAGAISLNTTSSLGPEGVSVSGPSSNPNTSNPFVNVPPPTMPWIHALQTEPGEFWPITKTGLATVHEGEIVGRPESSSPISLTIPVTVTLDGEVISRQVEQRIVRTVLNRGKKVA